MKCQGGRSPPIKISKLTARRIMRVQFSRRFCSATNHLMKHFTARIKASGPLSVAEYMKEVLTNPVSGYYMHRDVFGPKGDFITSPEICPVFGEMLAVFCINEWRNAGSPSKIQVVEFGPGRGSLSSDMLRVFSQFPDFAEAVSMHYVEISPNMKMIQKNKLGREILDKNLTLKKGKRFQPELHWYKHIAEVPKGYSFFLAHEFFDALPIHAFQKLKDTWHEVMVDIDSKDKLHFVLSRGRTLNSVAFLKHLDSSDLRDKVEVSPESGVVMQEIATRIHNDGGFGLIVDYGHDGSKSDTFRAFKDHKQVHPLETPGEADLTADVDFSYLRHCCKDLVQTHGPLTQQNFLNNLGIGYRLKPMFENIIREDAENLYQSVRKLMDPKEMGEVFKAFAILPLHKEKNNYVPAGFKSLTEQQEKS